MRQWRFEIFNRTGFTGIHGEGLLEEIRELVISSIEAVQSAKVFLIEANFPGKFAERLGKELLAESLTNAIADMGTKDNNARTARKSYIGID
ncbi:MAG: hypothetical protein JXB29_06080 [Sedimentisphaerales bacterium]|nr:hypothetical protein [Sedimentisphaerales bacterium]